MSDPSTGKFRCYGGCQATDVRIGDPLASGEAGVLSDGDTFTFTRDGDYVYVRCNKCGHESTSLDFYVDEIASR